MDFCAKTAPIWQFAGYFVVILKILVPIIIIVLGVIAFSKAVVSAKDDEINYSLKSLITKLLLGIVIFFIPTIVHVGFSAIKSASSSLEAAEKCEECLLHATKADCSSSLSNSNTNSDDN